MSGLYEGLFVMRDVQTKSEWLHYTGECIAGPLEGRALRQLEMNVVSFAAFKERFPNATVIANSTSWLRRLMGHIDGRREAPSFFRLPKMFTRTMRAADARLPDMEVGIGVVIGQRSLTGRQRAAAARFYPYRALRRVGAVQESLAGHGVLVVWDPEAASASAFAARLGERALALRLSPEAMVDERGNRFDVQGRVLAGPDAGQALRRLPVIATRWYGFAQTYPEAGVFDPGPGSARA